MNAVKAQVDRSVLIVVDLQPKFLAGIYERERVLAHSKFLIQVANLLSVPVIVTEQNRERMGSTEEEVSQLIGREAIPKMSFSCCGSEDFNEAMVQARRTQAILVGIETHICVSQTAVDLINRDIQVIVCPDAVSARTLEMHKLGMERVRDAGAWPLHSESVAYEWLGTADSPHFRSMLNLVKQVNG